VTRHRTIIAAEHCAGTRVNVSVEGEPRFAKLDFAFFESGLASHLHRQMPSFLLIYACYLKHAGFTDRVSRPHAQTVADLCGAGLRTVERPTEAGGRVPA
jgi:hypothetical protein